MTPDELERLTFRHMPEDFFRSVLRAVYQAHRVAWTECYQAFATHEATNVLGYYRRGKLEGLLRDVAARFPELTATVKRPDGTGWNHTEVRGGPVVLTENSVQTPCGPVDRAEFRLTLAENSQLVLWEEPRPEDAPLYALLLHSRSQWDDRDDRHRWSHLPGSAYIAFPSPDLGHYVHRINLFDRFPEVVKAETPQEWAEEARVQYLARARRVQVV